MDTIPVLTQRELADLLRLGNAAVARLVVETDLPRVTIDGEVRFLTGSVLAWLESQTGELLRPLPQVEAPRVVPRTTLAAAGPGETPFVTASALSALGAGAEDPGRNLDRLQLRDALLSLNDELTGVLSRLSHGRLHLSHPEKARTSPWRLDEGQGGRIDTLSMSWGEGDDAPPQFVDRSRIEVELSPGELRIALHLVTRGAVADTLIDRLRTAGYAVDAEGGANRATAAKVYPLGQPAPSRATVSRALASDLGDLVPAWVDA